MPKELWGVDPEEVGAEAPSAESAGEAGKTREARSGPAVAPAPGAPPGSGRQQPRPAAAKPPGAVPKKPPVAPSPQASAELEAEEAVDPSEMSSGSDAVDPSVLSPEDVAAEEPADDSEPAAPPQPVEQEELEGIPESGELAETSPLRIAYLVLAKKETCRVRLEDEPGVDLFFQKGMPVHAASEDPRLNVGAWLLERQAVTPDVIAKAEESKASFGGSLMTALMASGLVDAGSIFPHLTELSKESWIDALGRGRGSFRVIMGEAPPADGIPVGVKPGALFSEAARRLPAPELEGRLGDRLRAPVMRSNASLMKIEDLGLGPQETRLLGMLDGVRTPETLVEQAGTSSKSVLMVSWLLGECKFVSFGEPERAGSGDRDAHESDGSHGRKESSRAASPGRGEKRGAAASKDTDSESGASRPEEAPFDWGARQEELSKLEKRWEKLNHFEVLGVPRQCKDEDVKEAFGNLARRYHPDRVAMAPSEVQWIQRNLFERLRKAQAAVDTSAKRRAYMNELAAEEAPAQPEPERAGDDAVEKVRHLVKARKFDEAVKTLDEALAVNPGLAAAWAWRSLLKIQRAKDVGAVREEATGMIERALGLDPSSREVHLLAARVFKHYGDAAACKRHQEQAKALAGKSG